MTTETTSIGVAGGEDFATEQSLRPSGALVILLDSAVDAPGAFGRRQNDLRAALDGDGTVLLLIGPRIADGLATQFGVWVRAKIGADILPLPEAARAGERRHGLRGGALLRGKPARGS